MLSVCVLDVSETEVLYGYFFINMVHLIQANSLSTRLTTIGDKSVENIVENMTTSRKSVVRVKFQAPSSPIECWTEDD